MDAALDLNARIVAHLPPRALRASCYRVLRSEISDVSDRLKEVTAAFGGLKEVEAAVTLLQKAKDDLGRSASLMTLVADAERVQRELASKMGRVKHVFPPVAGFSDEVSRSGSGLAFHLLMVVIMLASCLTSGAVCCSGDG